MARNISLFIRRTAAKIKNGSDTKVAVDARGSACFRLTYNAILTINKEITIDVEYPNKIGKETISISLSSALKHHEILRIIKAIKKIFQKVKK